MLKLTTAFHQVFIEKKSYNLNLGDRYAKYDGIKSTKGLRYAGGSDGQALKITVKGL